MNDTTNPITTHEVSADRLQSGTWCHTQNRQLNEGDIAGSYSADVIATDNRIRKPFEFRKALYATVSLYGREGYTAEAYRLLQTRFYNGPLTTYHEKRTSQDAREDPNGFYHGMCIRHGKNDYVLVGPPQQFQASAEPVPEQGVLF